MNSTTFFDWTEEYEKTVDILSDEKLNWEVEHPGTYAFIPGVQGQQPNKREYEEVFENSRQSRPNSKIPKSPKTKGGYYSKQEPSLKPSNLIEESWIPKNGYTSHIQVHRCSNCNGTGKIQNTTILMNVEDPDKAFLYKDEVCPKCKGFGKLAEEKLYDNLTGLQI